MNSQKEGVKKIKRKTPETPLLVDNYQSHGGSAKTELKDADQSDAEWGDTTKCQSYPWNLK